MHLHAHNIRFFSNVPLQILGFLVLGGVKIHALNVTGLAINTAGGIWYSFAKYNQKQRKKMAKLNDEQLLPVSKWSS
jgi:hypothetical protein